MVFKYAYFGSASKIVKTASLISFTEEFEASLILTRQLVEGELGTFQFNVPKEELIFVPFTTGSQVEPLFVEYSKLIFGIPLLCQVICF